MVPHNARGRNRPRHRLASFGPDGTSLTQLTYYLQCVGEATLIGAEGDCALVGGVQGDSTVGAKILDATMWHLGTKVPLKGKDHKETVGFLI